MMDEPLIINLCGLIIDDSMPSPEVFIPVNLYRTPH
jgi:hypothetical protein